MDARYWVGFESKDTYDRLIKDVDKYKEHKRLLYNNRLLRWIYNKFVEKESK